MTNESDESLLQAQMCIPYFLVGDTRYSFGPTVLVTKLCLPILAHMLLKQVTQERRDPRRRVNSVSDVTDGNIFELLIGPELLPQRPRHFSVLATGAVGGPAHANGQRCQPVALHSVRLFATTKREKLIFRETKLLEVTWTKRASDQRSIKLIVAGCDRCVSGEDTLLFHSLHRACERLFFRLHDLARELERKKSGVTFVQMKDVWRHAEFSQQSNATDTKQH